MVGRIIVRITSNLSFAGERVKNDIIENEVGVLLKTNPALDLKIWCPLKEIKSVFLGNNKKLEGAELEDWVKNC